MSTPIGRVVVAPDAFRGSVTASQAAEAMARGIESVVPDADVRRAPIADGGEGTLDRALAAGFAARALDATGPLGDRSRARIAVRGREAVIELAELCGWARMPAGHTAPLDTHTRGLGDGILAALEAGCDDLVLAVGGSVSTDGGVGMLRVLGAVPLDESGSSVAGDGGRQLHRIRSLDLSRLDPRVGTARIRLATDVDNPLLGVRGAAVVFAPQKGATADDVAVLGAGLASLADVVAAGTGIRTHDLPGAGAAGGIGATALPYLGAEIVSGADVVLDLTGFDDLVRAADWVVTGEGKWDAQSRAGKAPARVALRAGVAGARVALVAGVIEALPADLAAAGFSASWALTEFEPDVARCLAEAETLLVAAGAAFGRRITESDNLD